MRNLLSLGLLPGLASHQSNPHVLPLSCGTCLPLRKMMHTIKIYYLHVKDTKEAPHFKPRLLKSVEN